MNTHKMNVSWELSPTDAMELTALWDLFIRCHYGDSGMLAESTERWYLPTFATRLYVVARHIAEMQVPESDLFGRLAEALLIVGNQSKDAKTI